MSSAQPCRQHPDRPAVALCQKYGHGACAECLANDPRCPDPAIYCKFRPQCLIFFQYKETKHSQSQD
ncbi:MAG: hypothetical protein ACOZHQ_02570 [Thermodesulfobacteriota bacterium]